MTSISLRATLLATTILVASCADGYVDFPVDQERQSGLEQDYEIVRLTADNVMSFAAPARPTFPTTLPANGSWQYLIGAGDVLDVIVFDYPDLTNPTGQTEARSGFRVQGDGSFFYPFIGYVRAGGRTAEQVRSEISERLREFLPDPQVEVRVIGYNSQKVVVTGAVAQPQSLSLTDVPLTLLDAVNRAGALAANADTGRVAVLRNGSSYQVNLERYLLNGRAVDNPILKAGDLVNVPRRLPEEVYLIGELRAPRAVDLTAAPLTLTQALAREGWINQVRADARGIFVFRKNGARTRVFQLDIQSPAEILIGTQFYLAPEDVIYITRAPITRWNDTVRQILPIIQGPTWFRDAFEDYRL